MRKDGTLRFGDFVSAILHLSVAFSKFLRTLAKCYHYYFYFINPFLSTDIFESKDPLQNGSVKMSLAEVQFALFKMLRSTNLTSSKFCCLMKCLIIFCFSG